MQKSIRKSDALDYHAKGRPGKIEVIPTKETKTQRDLGLAYSPGVAEPCREIAKNPENVYKYTAKGNLVAVISNGTAVLGLGDIGALASKPVMEGKGLLFKIYADIDVFDIELNCNNVEDFIKIVKALEPTFGGINLEDIKAPECFEIEERLKKELNIPIMHDDQHGTAIISAAALLNALELQQKDIKTASIVVSGAGASAMACCNLYIKLGAKIENIIMFDSKGAITKDRKDIDAMKQRFATSRKIKSLEDAMKGADVFIGLSKGGIVNAKMLKGMANNPIVFALANPDPEIDYETAVKARPDVIMATGRSDYPNQVNNVLGFPYIFRGALDVRAKTINEAMKLAAVKALASLAKKPVPEMVNMAYQEKNLSYGPTYIIPKPMDPRLLSTVSIEVAKAAVKSKVAQKVITDWKAYEEELQNRLGSDDNILKVIINKAKQYKQRVVFADAENFKTLKAAQIAKEEGIAIPILLGNLRKIKAIIKENNLELDGIEIIDPKSDDLESKRNMYGEMLFKKRSRKGYNTYEAKKIMRERNYFGCMMIECGEADALITGLTRKYPDTLKPVLEIIGVEPQVNKIAGMYIMLTRKGPICFADTTINEFPTANDLVEITLLAAEKIKNLNIKPRVAMLSYSNFGSSNLSEAKVVKEAVDYLHQHHPDLIVDGEIQASVAFNNELLKENYPFSALINNNPNILIFPNLSAGNIAYHLMMELGNSEAIGPILLGLNKSVHVLQLGSSVRQIVNMVAIASVDAYVKRKKNKLND
ncbi:MAG: NADP-dependent malic enzyme [Bacteroidetes bacterium]|jgi:malate dehydrogenase (oxaloacetate-decarboxylating)(NADP+)|nr:NADP-dependent malic enzyme [Bacteroidota bacterium]MBK9299459.1 NADP-dependent malic enzyme [Bacteroidota bacterium]